MYRQRTILEESRPTNQKTTNNWETHLTSTGDASAMSSTQDDSYNEVTYAPTVASPHPPHSGTPTTPCLLCRTNNTPSGDTRIPLCGECVRPSIQLRHIAQSSSYRHSTDEPAYCCRGGQDLLPPKALLIASPRCIGFMSPSSDAENSATAAAAEAAPYMEFALNNGPPRFLQSEKSCAVLADYAPPPKCSSKTTPDL